MNNETRPLLALYKLLWEQIKDEDIEYLQFKLNWMRDENIITQNERVEIGHHVTINFKELDSLDRKAFVQRMIKELENKL